MSTKSKIHQARLNEWAVLFSEQKASGLSVSDWCEKNNLSIHKYFYWKHLLKEEAVSQMLPEIIPISLPADSQGISTDMVPTTSSFSQVANTTLTSCTTCSCARISLNGVSIDLDQSAPEDFIMSLIRAVRHA